MSRVVVIDVDRKDLRVAVCTRSLTHARVERLVEVGHDSTHAGVVRALGEGLADVPSDFVNSKTPLAVSFGADRLQLKLLQLPPSPDEELPAMIRFQAEREGILSNAALDYVVLRGDATSSRTLAVVVASDEQIQLVSKMSSLAGATASSLLPRHLGIVRMLAGAEGPLKTTLFAVPMGRECDLVVAMGAKVLLFRTVILTGDESQSASIASQLRLTLAAARGQIPEFPVEEIVLVASSQQSAHEIEDVAQHIQRQCDIACRTVNVEEVIEHEWTIAESDKESRSDICKFVGGLGVATIHLHGETPSFDLLNVRQAEKGRKFERVHLLAIATAAIAVLAFAGQIYQQVVRPQQELAELREQSQQLRELVGQYESIVEKADKVERWRATDVSWLDQLAWISQAARPLAIDDDEFQVGSDLLVTDLLMSRNVGDRRPGGRISVTAKAKEADVAIDLETRLRDDIHQLSLGRGIQDSSDQELGWQFGLEVVCPPQSDSEEEETRDD